MDETPFSLIANLAKTPSSALNETPDGKVDFVSAMEQLGYTSLFDILRKSKRSFARDVRTLSNADGELAYDNAMCYATQIVRQYRNQLISSGRTPALARRTGIRSLVEIGPSFPNLFQENWDTFCKVGAIEAKDSPVAYLTSLYRFALEELEGSVTDTRQIKLSARRPDLKDLLIDHQATFKPVPVLEIVKQVLETGIQSYKNPDGENPQTLYQLIADKKHPFLFPYNYNYQQIQLGLSKKKPELGEINYRVSLKLPVYRNVTNLYGQIQPTTSTIMAQRLMSGLSPEQQLILIEPRIFSADDISSTAAFYTDYYNIGYSGDAPNLLTRLLTFLDKTGLQADQVETLLAMKGCLPKQSPNANVPPAASLPRTFGAQYINIDNATGSSWSISLDAQNEELTQTNDNSYDRLQRMIRLQRWTSMTFTELDTLIAAVARSEGNNPKLELNVNTLRALATYRYLHKHYKLAIEDFSVFIHDIPTYGIGDKPSMLDRLFNNPALFEEPFKLGTVRIYVDKGTPEERRASAQVCSAIGAQMTTDSLGIMIDYIYNSYNPPNEEGVSTVITPTTALWSVSSFYRQSRIAQLFGLSVKESWGLYHLLGGNPYIHAIVSGKLSAAPDTASPPDILDVLMQMDWAVRWLKETERDVMTVRRQLAFDTIETHANQTLLDTLNQLARDSRDQLITVDKLNVLNLPSDEAATPIDWWTLLSSLIDTHGLVNPLPLSLDKTPEAALREKIDNVLNEINLASKEDTAQRLSGFFLQALLTQQSLVEGLLQRLAGLSMNRSETVVRWAGQNVQTLLSQLLSATADGELTLPVSAAGQPLLEALDQVLRHAEIVMQLGISVQALRTFLVNPGWLDDSMTESLPLNLASLYLLDRYCRWVSSLPLPEDRALAYFALTHSDAASIDLCAGAMATLIDWSSSEINAAAKVLPDKMATTMAQVDWILRIRACSEQTGLSASTLLMATSLDPSDSQAPQWQLLGDEVMAASG